MVAPRIRVLILAAGVSLAAISGARSADLPLAPPSVPAFSGWYLRGDIGFSNQNVGSLFNADHATFSSVNNIAQGFDSAPFFLLGVGYTVNNWLCFDVTGASGFSDDLTRFDEANLFDSPMLFRHLTPQDVRASTSILAAPTINRPHLRFAARVNENLVPPLATPPVVSACNRVQT